MEFARKCLSCMFKQPSPSSVRKCLQVMEDALARFPDSSEVLLFYAEVRFRARDIVIRSFARVILYFGVIF